MAAELYRGKICKKHPNALRYRSNYNCVLCNQRNKEKWYKANPSHYAAEKEKQREGYLNNLTVAQSRARVSMNKSHEKIKNAVVNVLTNGEGTCRWCGQGDLDILTVDHINDDGAKHRREINGRRTYQWLIQNDYPPGFQILCFNCNVKKEVLRRRSLRKEAH